MWEAIHNSPLIDVMDILIVAYLLYRLIVFIKDTRVIQMLVGLVLLLVLSVLAAEDADFYRHRGLDYAGILRALVRAELGAGLAGLKLFIAAVALGTAMLALVWMLAAGVGDAATRRCSCVTTPSCATQQSIACASQSA